MAGTLCANVNRTAYARSCLLKYITTPFRHPPVYHRHQNMWQVPLMARIVGGLGYNVDVIDYDDTAARLERKYDLLIDIYPQAGQVYAGSLASGCRRILYATGAAPDWQTSREAERLDDLEKRRGVRLPARARVVPYPAAVSDFDALFLIGNQTTLTTYADLAIGKKHLITNAASPAAACGDLSGKSPRTFLFFATYPQVLKGLDLLLEVFARDSGLNLVICSQFAAEQDFCQVYARELHHCPNILPVGPVDITGAVFAKIAQLCSYVVLPSCSEGMSGSVLTAMAAGLVPVVSEACGLDAGDVHLIDRISVESLTATLARLAAKDALWVAAEARRAAQIAQTKYSPDRFAASFQTALADVAADR